MSGPGQFRSEMYTKILDRLPRDKAVGWLVSKMKSHLAQLFTLRIFARVVARVFVA